MNLWAKALALSGFIILALLTFSCEEEINEIGLPVENSLNLQYYEYDVPVSMVWVDSVLSSNTGLLYSGSYDFQGGGRVQATTYIPMQPITFYPNVNVPDSALTLTEVFLNMDVVTSIDGDMPTTETLRLYELADTINTREEYFTENTAALGNLIGEGTFTFYPDSVQLDQQSDTVFYGVRISIDNAIGQTWLDLLQDGDSLNFANLDLFGANVFKGLAVVPDANNSALIGYSPENTQIVIRYEYVNSDGETIEGAFAYNVAAGYYHNIIPNPDQQMLGAAAYSGISCCFENYIPGGDYVYQLLGTGINIKMDLSELREFTDSLGTTVINSAVLEIDGAETVGGERGLPSTFAFYMTDDSNRRFRTEFVIRNSTFSTFQTLQIESNSGSYNPLTAGNPLLSVYNNQTEQYRINIARFIEAVTNDDEIPAQFLIQPVIPNSASLIPVDRSSIVRRTSQRINAIRVPKDGFKIKIYYSTID